MLAELLALCQKILEKHAHLVEVLHYDLKRERLEEVNHELAEPDVWLNVTRAQDLGREKVAIEKIILPLDDIAETVTITQELLELEDPESPEEAFTSYKETLERIQAEVDELDFKTLLDGEFDANSCFLDFNAGAGGTEACDWTDMLINMYVRWANSKNYTVEILDQQPGDVAGTKTCSMFIKGDYAYGYLRLETGVHRLVRPSPFNALNKRQTSFASVYVYPEIDDKIEVNINPADLKVETFRSSGAGGQHVNKTESAVRITHIPSGIVVKSQTSRNQHDNRANCMRQLKAKLLELEQNKKDAQASAVEESKTDVNFGSQIRSYVLDDNRVKDVRTGYESRNPPSVLGGNIDGFLIASLRDPALKKSAQ